VFSDRDSIVVRLFFGCSSVVLLLFFDCSSIVLRFEAGRAGSASPLRQATAGRAEAGGNDVQRDEHRDREDQRHRGVHCLHSERPRMAPAIGRAHRSALMVGRADLARVGDSHPA